MSGIKTHLVTWNPKNWPWTSIETDMQSVQQQGFMEDRWSCGQTKSIIEGDRLFLLKQGEEPRGIVASGWATSGVYEDVHYNPKSKKLTALYIRARFDVLFNADIQEIYPRQKLGTGAFVGTSHMHWNPQGSGVTIPADVAVVLEQE